MRKGLIIVIVAILGLSTIGFGQMTSYGDDKDKDWYNFWHYFDYKKFVGFLNSGGSGGNNDDDDDDDDNDDNVDQSPIDHANISFNIGVRKLNDGTSQNVVDECIFSSEQTFDPLCIKCKFRDDDKDKTVVAAGNIEKLGEEYSNPGEEVIIEMIPTSVQDNNFASNDVRNVHSVELVICGEKNKCPDDHDNCKCDERKKDHAKHYYDFMTNYDNNKKKFGKTEYTKFMKDYEDYFDEEGKYMDKYDYKIFMDYHGKFLKDNKNYFSSKDYNSYSDKHKGYSKDYPKHNEKCECDGEKEDHKKRYDNFDKYYKDNKKKFGKAEYSKFMKDYEDYFDKEGKYMDSYEYKTFMDYHEKFLKDNKNYFSSSDYKHSSEEHEKYSKDHEKHHEEENECKEKTGFFTGGGSVNAPTYGKVTHGFELHCNSKLAPNNLNVSWKKPYTNKEEKFHLEELESAKCTDENPNAPPPIPHPGPALDTYTGEGYGRYNGVCEAFATWTMNDKGEPGTNDEIISLKIYDKKGGNLVLDINPALKLQKGGNHQFVPHPSSHPNPNTQTNPCKVHP
ncbi:MAG: hypothetical protein ACREAK_10680 [Nitrosarchaeum sp.]